jgi:hypothetical protein
MPQFFTLKVHQIVNFFRKKHIEIGSVDYVTKSNACISWVPYKKFGLSETKMNRTFKFHADTKKQGSQVVYLERRSGESAQ